METHWIPTEPFGYVTHHYGNWVYARNTWYWAPPVVSVRVGLPFLNIGFFWCPGRVSWIHSGAYVGWVPLAPRETYYSHRNWGGPHTVVVTNVNIAQININVRNYAYANHAVVVNQNNFYRVNNYRDVRVTNVNRTTIINNYRAAPVVNNTVINNYTTDKQRYNYANVTVNEKPHNTVINRIQHNETIIQGGRKENAAVVQERVKSTKEGRSTARPGLNLRRPRTTSYQPTGEPTQIGNERFSRRRLKVSEGESRQPSLLRSSCLGTWHRQGQVKRDRSSCLSMWHRHNLNNRVRPQCPSTRHRQGQVKRGQVVIPEHATPINRARRNVPVKSLCLSTRHRHNLVNPLRS